MRAMPFFLTNCQRAEESGHTFVFLERAFLLLFRHTELLEIAFELLGSPLLPPLKRLTSWRNGDLRSRASRRFKERSSHIVDKIGSGEISLVISTEQGSGTLLDSRSIGLVANEMKIPAYTTVAGASAAVKAIESLKNQDVLQVRAIQDYHLELEKEGLKVA